MLGPSSLTPAALPQPPSAFPVAGRLTAHTPCDPQRAEVERLVGLGARVLDEAPDHPWIVLADPEGNEFCILDA